MSQHSQHIPPPPPPAPSSPLPTIPGQAWGRALLITLVFFAGSLLMAGITAAFGATGSQMIAAEFGDEFAQVTGGSWMVLTIQLLAMGFLSPLSFGADVGGFIGFSGSMSLFYVPWLVPAGGVAAVAMFHRYLGGNLRAVHTGPRAVLAAVAGVTFASVVTVLAATVRFRFIGGFEDVGHMWAHAASVPGFLVAAVLVGITTYVVLLPPGAIVVSRILSGVAAVAEHILVLAVLCGVGLVIWWLTEGGEAMTLLLFFLPTIALAAVSMLHFIPAVASGSADFMGTTGAETLTMFEAPASVWIPAVVVMVLALGITALRWSIRSRFQAGAAWAWGTLLAGYLLAGVLLTAANGLYFSFFAFGEGVRGSIKTAAWGFLVWLAVGLVIQVLAAYVMPAAVYALPAGLVRLFGIGLQLPPGVTGAPPQHPGTADGPTHVPSADQHTQPVEYPAAMTAQPVAATHHLEAAAQPHHFQQPDAWPAAPVPASRKMKRSTKVVMFTVLGLAVLGVGAVIAQNIVARTVYGPQHTAEAYLQAVVDGRAEDALAQLGPNVTDELRALATDEVYAAASDRPDRFELGEVTYDGDAAHVAATVYQSGKAYPQDLSLRKTGSTGLIFPQWELTSGDLAGRAVYTVGPSQLTVNDVEVSLSPSAVDAGDNLPPDQTFDDVAIADLAAESGQVLLPGTYTFTAPESATYLSSGEDLELTITPGEPSATPIEFSQRYTEAFETDALEIIEERLEACLADRTIRIADCEAASWEDTAWTAMTDMQRVWDTPPQVELVPAGTDSYFEVPELTDYAGPVTARVTEGRINLTYQVRDDAEDDWLDRERVYAPFQVDYQPMEFPVTLQDDDIVVDFSALDEYNPDWLSPEFR